MKFLRENKILMKSIIVLAIPAIIENILQFFIGVVDMYYVGGLGKEAVSGVGISNLIMNIYLSFFIAIGVGTTAIVSRYIGEGDRDSAKKSIVQSLITTSIIGIIFGVISFIFAYPILGITGAEESVLILGKKYFSIVAGPVIFLSLIMVASAALRATGDTLTPMIAVIISNIINAVLDRILVLGVGNFKGMGIAGAALATSISRFLAAAIILVVLCRKFEIHKKFKVTIDKGVQKSLLKIGWPAATEKLVMRVGQIVYGALIIEIGTTSYAAHNIGGTIENLTYLPCLGFGIAAATLVGQKLGANKPDEAVKVGILSFIMATALMWSIALVFLIFPEKLAGIFSSDIEVIKTTADVLKIIAIFQPALSCSVVITSALQGAGDTKYPMLATLIGIWGVRVTGAAIFGVWLGMGLVGVWLSYALDISLRSVILMRRYIKKKWLNIEVNIKA
ncbi:MATE family efflux transporter [Oceanirhabdus sp. W0125-5]|uniref:MATE family efflux transporter n=1 Tax=Oceanirhabdus sp. W0125-5 TaxID=2999116 RepID=UPI0022F31E62|nr:MATE family efflux transporter [Oceanirhabdus sp. W0125-5]WBW96779.1 MATE family efflux transporter [Oceanirhabdus sp. W0125-5]